MNTLVEHIEASLRGYIADNDLRPTAWWVAEELTGLSRTQLLCGKGTTNIPNLETVLNRLRNQEPVQYVFGHTWWRGMNLWVNKDVLIPRPETSELVDWVLEDNEREILRIVDAGTGSGCIAIALKQARAKWEVCGLDISAEALSVARENADRQGVNIRFALADMRCLSEEWQADVLVSNPPYIGEQERSSMADNVVRYEPERALFVPDTDVLCYYRLLAHQKRAGRLYFEINQRYGAEIVAMLQAEGYEDVELRKDMQGNDRMVRALLPV
ncbi:MAG: peptide chain release factor N(5)-glutamine methyltransferase [Paludibacter sp.]|nr:peptide chain release factor N(5)-glutamine methyltransferase [Bacteroidales bacterium]MCM1068654.1 peptide chain release factor N(5)-glutamine methyltransferase [Prevotella sp.]MCM1353318.1 peptide chain release factor N(5)-glutamine methyltransferase [Bacteroides sp.]MCM1442274.1 peptide chain release factor N(5)-glutamine methyltransferase [Muribaculum sp.]MCM1481093.1 peptide chain release factor N(5)-glutamine methyltransferase [Paludibacter sp.]